MNLFQKNYNNSPNFVHTVNATTNKNVLINYKEWYINEKIKITKPIILPNDEIRFYFDDIKSLYIGNKIFKIPKHVKN